MRGSSSAAPIVTRQSQRQLARHRHVVDAFLAAAHGGDIAGLLAFLDPGVVRWADRVALPPGAPAEIHGAQAVAEEAVACGRRGQFA